MREIAIIEVMRTSITACVTTSSPCDVCVRRVDVAVRVVLLIVAYDEITLPTLPSRGREPERTTYECITPH